MTTTITSDLGAAVRKALASVPDPCSIATGVPIGLDRMGLVVDVDVVDATARIVLRITSPLCLQLLVIRQGIEDALADVPGINAVDIDVDYGDEWTPAMMDPEARRDLRRIRPLPEMEWANPADVAR